MATFMWTVWVVGTLLSLVTIYALLRVLYTKEAAVESTETNEEIGAK